MVEAGHLRRKQMPGGQAAHMTGDHLFPAGIPEVHRALRSRQMAVEIEQDLFPYRGQKIFFRRLQDERIDIPPVFPSTGVPFEQTGKLSQMMFFLCFPVCHDAPSILKKEAEAPRLARELPQGRLSGRAAAGAAGPPPVRVGICVGRADKGRAPAAGTIVPCGPSS